MCGTNFGGNSCLWIILILVILFCGGCGSGCGGSICGGCNEPSGCGSSCGC